MPVFLAVQKKLLLMGKNDHFFLLKKQDASIIPGANYGALWMFH